MNEQPYPTKRSYAMAAIIFGLLLCRGDLLIGRGDAAPAQQPEMKVTATDSVVTNHPAATVSLPAPYKVVGGGARANWSLNGSLLTQSQPGGAGSNAWTVSSKDHFAAEPVSVTAYAIGLADPADEWEVIVRESRSPVAAQPVATASLPPGYVMTGGGCLDDWRTSPSAAGNLLTGSFPSSANSWECRGQEHGAASPASIVAYVIGIRPKKVGVPLPEAQITSATSEAGAHVTAIAPAVPGFVVTGGGAVTGRLIHTLSIPTAGTIQPPRLALQPTAQGQLLTATFPEVAAGSIVASGWRAAAKDHMYASPGTVTAYAVNLRFAQQLAATPMLLGWVDLHTHPMSNLAFGGKLFHGAPDSHPDRAHGSLMPAVQMPYDRECRFDQRAISMEEALSDDAPTHGDVIQSRCGNSLRNLLVQVLEEASNGLRQPGHAVGAPTFANWPKWNDVTHQKMWVDWIRRAKDGGLRVMVALSHNSRLLAEVVGSGGPISGVKNDTASSDLQLREIAAFVAQHDDFMRVAKSSAELSAIVQAGKIAVVLGVEIDNIGDFNDKPVLTARMIEDEINRLYDTLGVRYILPIHLTDNAFGDAAIYNSLFNLANYRETGRFWTVGCGGFNDEIGFESLNFPPALNPFIPPGAPQPPRAPSCWIGDSSGPTTFLGHVNARTPPNASNPIGGLTPLGEFAIKHMMKRGIIIDIDHMSDRAVNRALQIAESIQPGGGYPVMSGHSGIRNRNSEQNKENSRSIAQLGRIACLGGMFGLGTDGIKADDWANQYMQAFNAMSNGFAICPGRAPFGAGMVAFGTDTNSMVKTPRPTMVDFQAGNLPAPRFADIYNPNNPNNGGNALLPVLPRSSSGARTWDYNTDGVAHYGMFADFVKDVRTLPADRRVNGKDLVDNRLMRSADYFYRMWQKAEAQKSNVR